jgi:hypothetical protein
MFRASTDSGATFSDKINLSNSTDVESQNAEIVAAAGENSVFVLWWETNQLQDQVNLYLKYQLMQDRRFCTYADVWY